MPHAHLRRLLLSLPILLALGLCGATLAGAYMVQPLSLSELARAPLPAPVQPRRLPVPPRSTIERALDRDPFHPERRRSEARYRLPDAAPAAVPAYASPTPQHLPGIMLLGIASYGKGKGLAALSMPGRSPRLVQVGDSYEGYRLTDVTPTDATLVGRDTTLVLRTAGGTHHPGQP